MFQKSNGFRMIPARIPLAVTRGFLTMMITTLRYVDLPSSTPPPSFAPSDPERSGEWEEFSFESTAREAI